jgi:hypothetical protein
MLFQACEPYSEFNGLTRVFLIDFFFNFIFEN